MTENPGGQRLVDEQSASSFDQDYIDDALLDQLVETLQALRPQIAHIADFGGGNGRFLDRLLRKLPHAHGINYELSARLRSINESGTRKSVVGQSFLSIAAEPQFDLVLMNWVLHHLIGDNLGATRRLLRSASDTAYVSLRPGGMLAISENVLNSLFPGYFSSIALYFITRSRLLKPVTSRMKDGKAVAGVGIYYMSEGQIHDLFSRFDLVAALDKSVHDYGWKLKLIGISQVKEKVLLFRKPLGSPDIPAVAAEILPQMPRPS